LIGGTVSALDFFVTRAAGQDRFAKLVAAELTRRNGQIKPRYNRDEFSLEWGQPPARLFLENTYWDWLEARPAQRPRLVGGLIALVFDQEAELGFEASKAKILPVVRNRRVLLADPVTNGAAGPSLAASFHTLCGDLAVLPAVVGERSISLANQSLLEEWGTTHEALMELAVDNLAKISPPRFETLEAGFRVTAYDDHLDASRMLLSYLFSDLMLEGPPIAVVASRRLVAVAGANNTEGLTAMAEHVAKAMSEETRPIWCSPVILNQGEWWPLNPGAPQAQIFHRLYVIQAEIDATLPPV
jgi:uncharacterized protein YtpQ (UPF0354 family)